MPPAYPSLFTSNHPPTFAALDFETANNDRTSVCAVGVVRVEAGRIVARERRLVRPPTADFSAARVHGIRLRDVASEPGFPQVWRALLPLFAGAAFIAAHNAPFERSVLDACARRFSVPRPKAPFECTMMLARRRWGLRPTKLCDVARHLRIPLVHHDPLSDAEACARIILAAAR